MIINCSYLTAYIDEDVMTESITTINRPVTPGTVTNRKIFMKSYERDYTANKITLTISLKSALIKYKYMHESSDIVYFV